MYGEEIAKYVNVANIILVCMAIAVAVCGVFVLLNKFFKWTNSALFNMGNFIPTFCVAAVVALAAEATVFNFQHYLKFFAGDEIYTTTQHPDDPYILQTNESSITAEIIQLENGQTGVVFKNLNKSVTSVFADVEFVNISQTQMDILWQDTESNRQIIKSINSTFPHDLHTAIQPSGDVHILQILFSTSKDKGYLQINSIVLNRPIPFYFSGLRMLVLSLLIFAFIVIINKTLCTKATSLIFEYKFDPSNKKQNFVYALTVIVLIIFSWACIYTSIRSDYSPTNDQYAVHLVDALIAGRTWLNHGNPEKLLEAERPYDRAYREINGFDDVMWDWAWYKGKYYSYFGVVPAVLLYVPYKLITGGYLPIHAGLAIIASALVVLLAFLWRVCVKKYLSNMRFTFYLLSFLTLYFASGLFASLRHVAQYSVVQVAGVTFAVAGALLLLKSIDGEKVSRVKLFFACLCFALIAGCRPQILIAPLFLLPVILWKHRSWKLAPIVTIPFVIVAIPLMYYNYVRFESIFDFGANYNLTIINMTTYNQINPLGYVTRIFVGAMYYLFYPIQWILHFPFMETRTIPRDGVFMGATYYFERGASLINFPIVFCLLYYFRNILNAHKPKTFPALSALLAAALIIIVANSFMVGFVGRYLLDLSLFILFPALFCAYYFCANANKNNLNHSNDRLIAAYLMLSVSIFVGLFLFVSGTSAIHIDLTLYRYLEYSLGIMRDV